MPFLSPLRGIGNMPLLLRCVMLLLTNQANIAMDLHVYHHRELLARYDYALDPLADECSDNYRLLARP